VTVTGKRAERGLFIASIMAGIDRPNPLGGRRTLTNWLTRGGVRAEV
jgi:hypothetical protein